MITEKMLRTACRREHRALIGCSAEGLPRADEDRDVLQDIAHHAVVLYVLRDYLAQKYHGSYPAC